MNAPAGPPIDAVLLAAGASSRMAPHHKLLLIGPDGRSMAATALAALSASRLRRITVVLGHQAGRVAATLPPDSHTVICPDHAQGLSASLRCGLAGLAGDAGAVLVALADMPLITPGHVDALIAAWRPGLIVAPSHAGRRGNPVIWDRQFVPAMMAANADQGARGLLQSCGDRLALVPFDDDAVLRDADTPAAVRALPGRPWHAPAGDAI